MAGAPTVRQPAPTTPSGLTKSSSTQTTIRVTWTASTDNVGVAGYRLYRAGALAGTSLVTNYTFSSLTCGTTYVLEAAAYDAAGNSSARTSLTTATSACSAAATQLRPRSPERSA